MVVCHYDAQRYRAIWHRVYKPICFYAVNLQLQYCCNIILQYHALCESCLWQPHGMKESLCNL